MPHRRRVQKGSFIAHFDELVVKHFAHAREVQAMKSKEPTKQKRKPKICVHQALFERSRH